MGTIASPNRSHTMINHLRSPLRLTLATLTLALVAVVSQTAFAAPADGPMGGPMGAPMGGPGMHQGMHGGMGGGMGMDGRHIGRMLDLVNATPEQRSQIKQIVEAAHKDLAAQHAAGRQLHEQGQAIFLQPNVDARAAEALRQQMLAQHDAASKRMMQAMLDVSRVLTPEQRKTLSDKMAQRRTMMERHRAERQQIDGTPPR
jgi:Spy/CpxP family protein refolding chaperone